MSQTKRIGGAYTISASGGMTIDNQLTVTGNLTVTGGNIIVMSISTTMSSTHLTNISGFDKLLASETNASTM